MCNEERDSLVYLCSGVLISMQIGHNDLTLSPGCWSRARLGRWAKKEKKLSVQFLEGQGCCVGVANQSFILNIKDGILFVSPEQDIHQSFKWKLSNLGEISLMLNLREDSFTKCFKHKYAPLSSRVIGLMPDLKMFNEQAFLLSVPLIALKAFQGIQTTFEGSLRHIGLWKH